MQGFHRKGVSGAGPVFSLPPEPRRHGSATFMIGDRSVSAAEFAAHCRRAIAAAGARRPG